MKIKPNYLYRVLGDLEKEGRVKKDGRQYYPGRLTAAQPLPADKEAAAWAGLFSSGTQRRLERRFLHI